MEKQKKKLGLLLETMQKQFDEEKALRDKNFRDQEKAKQQQIAAERMLRDITIQFMEEGADKQLAIFDAQTNDIVRGLVGREETITAIKLAAENERTELLEEMAETKKQEDIQNGFDLEDCESKSKTDEALRDRDLNILAE